jgi:integrase
MSFNDLIKTKYQGLYCYKDTIKGKVFVAQFKIEGRRYRKIVGYSNDEFRTTDKIAYLKKESLVQEYKQKLTQGDILSQNKIFKKRLLKDLFDDYIQSIEQSQSQSTIATKKYNFNKHIKSELGNKTISTIDTIMVQSLINKILKTNKPNTKIKYSPQTATHINNLIKALYTYAIKMNYLETPFNPGINVVLPDFDNTVEYTLTNDEAKRLFNTIINYKQDIYRGIFTFLLHGHRKSEVLSLAWNDDQGNKLIDLEKRFYKIPYTNTKNNKHKIHPITELLYVILLEIDDKNGYVFKNPQTGTRFNDIKKIWAKIKLEAGIVKPFRIHDIRHLIGNTTLNELGMSSNIAAAILGNAPAMVEKRYSKVRYDTISYGLNAIFEHLKK